MPVPAGTTTQRILIHLFLVGTGLGLQWQPNPDANFRLTYGVPLVNIPDRGNSWQENGIYFSFTVQPF